MNDALRKASKWADYAGDFTERYGSKFIVTATAVIGASAAIDWAMGHSERRRAEREEEKQERLLREKNKRFLQDQFTGIENPGLVQDLFDRRTGHSNVWGGQKY